MPGPPPPPPPGAMPPPPSAPMMLPKQGKGNDRDALLKLIQKGARLKQAVTNDRSAPIVGKVGNNNSTGSSPSSAGGTPTSTPNGLSLAGGLFAGGMPKLKPTGKLSPIGQNFRNSNDHSSNRKPALPPQPVKNSNSVQNELKKQLYANDNRNRGPPPPAPASEETDSRQLPFQTISSTNGVHQKQSSLHENSNVQLQIRNNSTLHRKAKSNVSLSSLDGPEPTNGFSVGSKPAISHGKPNLAPKPPVLNAKPSTPPKRHLINGKQVSRAHSMRSPRSPSPQSPDHNMQIKFGTVRNLSSVIGQSLANSTGNLSPRPRPTVNGRPNAPPPSIPSQQPPPTPPHNSFAPPPPAKTGFVKPPSHAPPPPPTVLPQPPAHTPPPPPHRMYPSRAPPTVPISSAPPPPPRHSSMSSTRKLDFEEKFKFRDPSTFPKPPPYKGFYKFYGSKQAGSKQQAPQPPNFQSTNRSWDASSTC